MANNKPKVADLIKYRRLCFFVFNNSSIVGYFFRPVTTFFLVKIYQTGQFLNLQ